MSLMRYSSASCGNSKCIITLVETIFRGSLKVIEGHQSWYQINANLQIHKFIIY